ncbi:Hint domain-containing protein [Paracoccaceae bacterium GXU_MW_L88]
MANEFINASTLYLGDTSYSGAGGNGAVFTRANSFFTKSSFYTDPSSAQVGGIPASNTSTVFPEDHPQDDVYLELGEAMRIDQNDDGSEADDSWLRITEIARYGGTQVTLNNGETVTGAVNLVTITNTVTGESYQTVLFGDNMVDSINAETQEEGVGITSVTLGNYVGTGSGRVDLTQVMLASNFDGGGFAENVEFVCFTRGTMIETETGPRAIETLSVGDVVETATHGPQAIRWIGQRRLSAADLTRQPKLRPIRIRAGALGPGVPAADLLVSPQHRIRVQSKIVARMCAADQVLIPAKRLLALDGVEIAEDVESTAYFHILLDHHAVITANGAPCETLFPGPITRKNLGEDAWAELSALFPEFTDPDFTPIPAHGILRGRKIDRLVMRHLKNNVPFAAPPAGPHGAS